MVQTELVELDNTFQKATLTEINNEKGSHSNERMVYID